MLRNSSDFVILNFDFDIDYLTWSFFSWANIPNAVSSIPRVWANLSTFVQVQLSQ